MSDSSDTPFSSLPASVKAFVDEVLELNPMHRRYLTASFGDIREEEIGHLTEFLAYSQAMGHDSAYMAECYLTILEDTLREQIYFQQHRKYRYSKYSEVADFVYHNLDYMNRYMYGLALSSFLWPNHLKMARQFIELIPRGRSGKYLEIGPGHGHHIMQAMQNCAFDEFVGVDISEASIEQTRAIVGHFLSGSQDKLKLVQADFLQSSDFTAGSFDAVVMGEVLEHVETPELFLQRIVQLSKPNAFIYITTCLNAPSIDHIYLWERVSDLEDMIRGCGLEIVKGLRLPYEGKTLDECEEQGFAVNVAYELKVAK